MPKAWNPDRKLCMCVILFHEDWTSATVTADLGSVIIFPPSAGVWSCSFLRFPCIWMTLDVYNWSSDSSWARRQREDAGIMGTHHQINFKRASLAAIRLHNKWLKCVFTDRSCLRAYSSIFIRLTRSFFRFSWPFLSPCRNAIWAWNKKIYIHYLYRARNWPRKNDFHYITEICMKIFLWKIICDIILIEN